MTPGLTTEDTLSGNHAINIPQSHSPAPYQSLVGSAIFSYYCYPIPPHIDSSRNTHRILGESNPNTLEIVTSFNTVD